MKLRVLLATACAGLLIVPSAFAEIKATIGLSGDVETNTTWEYKSTDRGAGGSDDLATNSWAQDGRTHLKLTGRIESESGWFAAGQGDAMMSTGGNTGVDDAWLQFGSGGFATKVGRYEFEGIFSKGEDVYIAGAPLSPGRYEGNYMRGRFSGSAGNIGFDFNLGEASKMQVGLVLGGIDDNQTAIVTETDPDTGQVVTRTVTSPIGINVYGIRPVFVFSGGAFTVKVGGEYGTYQVKNDRTTVNNVWVENKAERNKMGGAVDFSMNAGAMTFGVAGSYGVQTGKTITGEDLNDTTQMAVFGWFKMAVGEADTLGLGVGYLTGEVDNVADSDSLESYVSYVHQMPVEGLKVKFGGSYAVASADADAGGSTDSDAYGVRMRFNYDF